MHENERVEFANILRGVAAVLVLLAHYGNVFWNRRDAVAGLIYLPQLPDTIGTPTYIGALNSIPLVEWGPFGVALFFLISGFAIPFSLSKATATSFGVNRLFRLLPTYVVGFSFTLAALYFGAWYFGQQLPLRGSEVAIHYIPGLRDILHSRGIDGVVWTLEVEVKFYVLCGALAFLFRRRSIIVFIVPLVIFAVILFLNEFMPTWATSRTGLYNAIQPLLFSGLFIVYMFIGTGFFFAQKGYVTRMQAMLLAAALFFLVIAMWRTTTYGFPISKAWSYFFAVVIFAAAFVLQRWFVKTKITTLLADISYPLYVIHGVAGYVLLRLLVGSGVPPKASLFAVTAFAIIMAWVVHRLIEAPSQRWGKRLSHAIYERAMDRRNLSILTDPLCS